MKKVLAKGLIVGGVAHAANAEVDLSKLSKDQIARLDEKGFFAGKAAAKGTGKADDDEGAGEE